MLETAGRARPASEFSISIPVKAGTLVHVFLSGRGHRGLGQTWNHREGPGKGEGGVVWKRVFAAQPPRPECLPRSHMLSPPVLLPPLHRAFPTREIVFIVPDGDCVSHVSWITWTAAVQVPSRMSFLFLPLPTLSLSVCLSSWDWHVDPELLR